MRFKSTLLCALALCGAATVADAAKIRIRQPLAATAGVNADGRARLTLTSSSQGRFEVLVRGLAPKASYDLIVDGVRVATLATNKGGKARVRFRTRPRGDDLALGFDPRGATVVVRSAAGDDVLVASIPTIGSGDAGDVICCVPDDSGPECEDRTPAECQAQGGTVVAGATSCLPNPCAGAAPVGNDILCCIPDDSGPECEDRTQAECLAAGGSVLAATSCTPNPCAPTPPAGGEGICCLPDRGGDGAPECEDLTASACTAAGGTVSSATSCTPDPCAGVPGGGGGNGQATVRVTCERRANRSKVSVDGSNLAAGTYAARAVSGNNIAEAPARASIGDEVEFDFDSDGGDIAAGATPIAAGFIAGTPPQVNGRSLDAGGSLVVEATVTCTEQ